MLKKIMLATTLLASSNVSAELLSMSFTDTNSVVVTKIATVAAINPSSDLSIQLSGGIGRSVGVEFIRSGNIIASGKSGMITVADELTFDGRSFYGHTISVPKPTDGHYTVKAYIYDINNNIVNTDAYSITVDTISPKANGSLSYRQRSYSAYNNYDISSNINSFTLINNSDDSGKIVSAQVIAKKVGETNFNYAPATVELNGDVSLLTYPSSLLTTDGKYDFGFALFDLAGNKLIVTKEYNLDNSFPETSFSHVLNHVSGLWDEYTSGMAVNGNPSIFRVKAPKSSHRNFSVSGTGLMNNYSHVDDNFVYYNITVYKPASYTYIVLYTEAGIARSYRQTTPNFVLANGVDEAPQQNGYVDYMTSDGVWHDTHSTTFNKPTTISKVRIHAKIRNYEQLGIFNGSNCVIPPGDGFCEVVTTITKDSGSGYQPIAVYLQSSVNGVYDSRFNVHIYYLLIRWDLVAPNIDELTTSGKTVTMAVTDPSKPNNWTNGMWNTAIFTLRATNLSTGAVIEIPHVSVTKTSYNTFVAKLNLGQLPEGRYSILGTAKDTYGNETTLPYSNYLLIDNSAPVLLATYDGNTFPEEINGLEDISLLLTDPSLPKIDSIQLTGGPTNSVVNLAWRSIGINTYGLEYPKLFPSLIQGEDYLLTINYSDSFANSNNFSVTFKYIPANLVNVGIIDTFAVNKNLLTQLNVPLTYILSPSLLDDNGELARGDQILDITLRSDADFAVIVEGVVLEPGQTKIFTINVSLTNGQLKIPVYPAIGGVVGNASFMVSLPLIQANN